MADVKRIELATGTFFYPHADRVLWTEDSKHPSMSWPLPLKNDEHALIHQLALDSNDPQTRHVLFSLLSIDSAYAQMTLTDGRAKRDHVCAMIRKAVSATGKEPTT